MSAGEGSDETMKKEIKERARTISSFANDLSRVGIHVAVNGPMEFEAAQTLLCEELKMMEPEPPCGGDFTLFCNVHL